VASVTGPVRGPDARADEWDESGYRAQAAVDTAALTEAYRAARIAAIEAAPAAPESAANVEKVARALYVHYGESEFGPWETASPELREDLLAAAVAAISAMGEQ
jgi:hypothetical protein